jgi:hypothetical protein
MITILDRVFAYLLSLLHIQTIAKTIVAIGKGIAFCIVRLFAYVAGKDKPELKVSNSELHHKMTDQRRFIIAILASLWFAVGFIAWVHRPFAIIIFVWVQLVIFFLIGRSDPVLNRVQTPRMAGEQLIRNVFDEVTLTPTDRKAGLVSTRIVNPPTRIKHGYEVTVRIPGVGKPDKAFTVAGKADLAHKLQKDVKEVLPYKVKGDASLIKLMVLDVDPWTLPPTVNPLVANPKVVNLWRDKIDLGMYADSRPYLKMMVEKGDGGGVLAGGAPRRGKSNWLSNLIVAILLDPTASIHMIDGKAIDFEEIREMCKNYIGDPDLEDTELLALSIQLMEKLKAEVNRRRKILLSARAGHVTEQICKDYSFGLEFLFIDELAVLTTDLMSQHKQEVLRFRELLGWLVRMGPAFGVFCVLATQRPSDTSVPDEIRSMIIWRIAFYISSVTGSQAILGKAGPAYRADWLDPEQKGVAIAIGEGQLRPHLVEPDDLAKVVQFCKIFRSGPTNPTTSGKRAHPEPVKFILEIFAKAGQEELETSKLLVMLQNAGYPVSAESLAKSLRAFGIKPTRIRVNGTQLRGYVRSHFEAVPMVVTDSIFDASQDETGTCGVTPEDEYRDGLAANEGDDNDS